MVLIQYYGDRSGNESGHTEDFEKIVKILGLSPAQRSSLISLQKLKIDATAIPTMNPETGEITICIKDIGWKGVLLPECDWKAILENVRARKTEELTKLTQRAHRISLELEVLNCL